MVLDNCYMDFYFFCFRPLAGMVLWHVLTSGAHLGIRPLTGMVPEEEIPDDEQTGFRPLTGIVLFH